MRLKSFRGWNWENDGYWMSVPVGFVPTQSIQPQIIPRAGTTASFGVSVIAEMTIPCEVGYQGPLSYQKAWQQLFRKIEALNTTPGLLVAVMNDASQQSIRALPMVPPGAAMSEVNVLPLSWVAVDAYWQSASPSGFAATTDGD